MATAFDAFVGGIDHPMVVVTAAHGGERSGCLVGFSTQVSIHPPRYLVCISKENHTYPVAERSDHLALHLLGSDQTALARLFGEETGDVVDKFERCEWHLGQTGTPVLRETAASMEGRVIGRLPVGDHEAFIMRGLSSVSGTHKGLLTYRSAPMLDPGHPA